MKRKAFLASSAAASLGILGGMGMTASAATRISRSGKSRNGQPGEAAQSLQNGQPLIAGKTAGELYQEYYEDLFNRFLPNLSRYVIDHEYGGFMCNTDIRTGERLSTDKRAWYEGRGIWMYSFLYNHIEKDEEFLSIAEKSVDFIMKRQPEPGNFWTASFSREGEPLSGPGNIYGDLFVAEGLAEYAVATGEDSYREKAKELLLNCVNEYDKETYRFHNRTTIGPEIPGPRVLGHWMLFLIISTQMLRHKQDPEIEQLASRSVDAIMNRHRHPEHRLLMEFLHHDFSIPESEFANFSYLGVAIETLWMVLYEAVRRKDDDLLRETARSFRYHVTVAKDAVYGGYFRSLDEIDQHMLTVDKVLWLQEEVLIGSLYMIEHLNDPWALECFEETDSHVRERYVKPGYKFWIPSGNRKLTDYRTNRVENYHHPRHLMLNLLSARRMAERTSRR